jgi:enoyl-CoA hydratase/carnithine racemase
VSTPESTVIVTRDGHVATVALNRPHRHNAWTGRMHREYKVAMAGLEDDPSVRAVVVTGTPPAFCVGGDSDALAGHAERGGYDPGDAAEAPNPGHGGDPQFDTDLVWHLRLRTPVIAAVNGACAGIGLALALFCDLRFVSAAARITTAAPRLGLPAEYGMSWVLPRIVGVTRANDLLLSGRVFTGAETESWGLWNGVAPDGTAALAAAQDYAKALASTAGPNAVAATKAQIWGDLVSHGVGESITESVRLINEATGTAEYREGVSALREKRQPRFD